MTPISNSTVRHVDRVSFVDGSSAGVPILGVFNETPTDPTEDQAAAVRVTAKRGLHANLRDALGVEQKGQRASADSIPTVLSTEQQATLDAISTEATLALVKAKTDNLDIALSALRDALKGGANDLTTVRTAIDAVAAAVAAFNADFDGRDLATETTLAAVLAAVDGVEALLTTIRDNTDTL